MTDFVSLLQQGVANAWLFIPSAVLLGALHGLEPGHSKTMMAAFIIAIQGTVRQAIMLGLAATLSHTVVVWLIALGGMYLSNAFTAEATEPWLQLCSGFIILGTAAWMFWRTWQGERQWDMHHHEHHHHHDEHHHDEHHHDEQRIVDTGHGRVMLAIIEETGEPRWRLTALSGAQWAAEQVYVETERSAGERQRFCFVEREGYLESAQTIPEPHSFLASLTLGHGDHHHDYPLVFSDDGHGQPVVHNDEYQDAHEQAHASEIRRRFADGRATNGQILLFGLTGGLLPCPAAITVLLLCLQVKAFSLGAALVVCFSIGLALTLVAVGVGAAISVKQVSRRWSGFSTLARRAPYFSSLLIALVGAYMLVHGAGRLNFF
ncbi:nickel/cobalt efflux transporter [Musicola keenii]|uniref:nickel/cobalt efflux transporter n=1 Tax=Musicola keenii TaxID=2884250 RepID=UPI001782AF51|nr:nickel/cobalt efflux transporter [Musicola keenii]